MHEWDQIWFKAQIESQKQQLEQIWVLLKWHAQQPRGVHLLYAE